MPPSKPNAKQIEVAERMLKQGVPFVEVAKSLGVKYQTLYARVMRQRAQMLNAMEQIRALEEENELLRISLAEFDKHPSSALADVLSDIPPRKRKRGGAGPRRNK